MPGELKEIATPAITYLTSLAQARGIEIEVADPGDLVFTEGRLRNGGRAVDVMVRVSFTPMLYLGERLDGIKAALRAGIPVHDHEPAVGVVRTEVAVRDGHRSGARPRCARRAVGDRAGPLRRGRAS